MGYTTEFDGSFAVTPALKPEHKAYLEAFANTRRMERDPNKITLLALPDPIRKAVGLPLGLGGGYFVGATGWAGQDESPDILDYNSPPDEQPGLWCQWVPNEDGTAIEWNEIEKFYDYIEWLEYLITHFLAPWGYTLNGEVTWEGEDSTDLGKIVVNNNTIQVFPGRITYTKA